MPADPRIEEAFSILRRPGGPSHAESTRARELLRGWLEDEDRAQSRDDADDEPSSAWDDAAPPELLNERARAITTRAARPGRAPKGTR